ncbi:MAG: PH domain-containing protein [Thermoanaerobaculia bacterium]
MGFIDESLLPGETVIYRAHVHWKVFVLPAFFAIAAAVIAGSALVFPANAWLLIPGGILAVPAVIIGIERWIRYSASEFAVTERRVLIKVGVIRRHSVELMLTKVEGIGVTQTVPGRLLNFGSISVTGTGGTRETFHEISSPMEFRRQVQARIGMSDESDAQPSGPAPPAKP